MRRPRLAGFIVPSPQEELIVSAFQSYAGAYEFCGKEVRWRCYANARLHGLRRADHAPLPAAPNGKKWLSLARDRVDPDVKVLVDQDVEEISQILLRIDS
jgi:hypothetical protein